MPKWWNNSCFLDSVIACLFFRENPYLINRLLKSRVQPFTLTEKKRINENNSYRNETNSEFAERLEELNDNCSVDTRNDIRSKLDLVHKYINDKLDDDKLIDRKSKTGTKLPRRLRNLRETLKGCELATFENFSDTNQREANEFLKFIFALFPDDKPNL